MALISIPTISDGTVIDANDVNNPLNIIVNELNGNLDYNNLANNAVIDTKIADNAVTTNKVLNDAITSDKVSLDVVSSSLASTFVSGASATFQATGLSLTLPTAGTWLVFADVRTSGVPTASTWSVLRLFNSTTSTEITDSRRITHFASDAVTHQVTTPIIMPVTTTTSNNVIRVDIQPSTAVAHTVYAEGASNGTSRMMAIRIG